jgi:hypothetical protein
MGGPGEGGREGGTMGGPGEGGREGGREKGTTYLPQLCTGCGNDYVEAAVGGLEGGGVGAKEGERPDDLIGLGAGVDGL